ncbi:MAG: hypothetical protein D6738_02870, partial [Acidobacteria bacterium]
APDPDGEAAPRPSRAAADDAPARPAGRAGGAAGAGPAAGADAGAGAARPSAPTDSGAASRASGAAPAPRPAGALAGAVPGGDEDATRDAPGGTPDEAPAPGTDRTRRTDASVDEAPEAVDDTDGRDALPSEVVVWLEAAPKVLAPGETLAVTLRISAPDGDVGGVPCHVLFDPRRLEWVDAEQGSFLTAGAETAFLVAPVAPGRLAVGASRLGADQGARGDGVIGRLAFRAREAGSVDLAFDRASVRDPQGRPLPARFVGTRVIVASQDPP